MELPIETNDKIKKNAISAYLMIFVSIFFLTNKTNPLLANNFVRSHTKTAFIIHIAFLAVTIVFLWGGLFSGIQILEIGINKIISSTLLLGLFAVLLYGIHQANKGKYFTIVDIMNITKTEKIIDINNDNTLDEKDKLTLILAYIPFVGYIVSGMYSKNPALQSITKINVLSFGIITFIYILGHTNVSLLLSLIYIVFIVFSSIILVGKNEILSINLEFIPTFGELENYVSSLMIYLKGFFNKKFKTFKTTLEESKVRMGEYENEKLTFITKLPKYKGHPLLVYIPLVNLYHLFYNKNILYYHIANGLGISTLILFSWIAFGINNSVQTLLLFPLFFGISFVQSQKTYTLPFISHLGLLLLATVNGLMYIGTLAKKMNKEQVIKSEPKKTPN